MPLGLKMFFQKYSFKTTLHDYFCLKQKEKLDLSANKFSESEAENNLR